MSVESESGALIRSSTTEVKAGPPLEAEVKSWIDSQIPYENFAGRYENLDQDVLGFIEGTLSAFQARMVEAYERWEDAQSVANGLSLAGEYEDDVHVPETYKRLQAKVGSIEESLWEIDPPFQAEGVKDEMPRLKAMIVTSFIRRQLELAQYRNYVRPTAVDAELTGWAAVKVVWERMLEEIVERDVRYEERNGRFLMHDERRLKKALVVDNAMLQQVDPFRLIIDLEAGQVKDCAFIGDRSDQFVHVLEQKADLGLFSKDQVKKLKNRTYNADVIGLDSGMADQAEMARRSRSVISPFGGSTFLEQDRGPRRVPVVELWGYYDFKDGYDGVTHPDGRKITGVQRVVMTQANRVLLQLRLNPFDKKFPPYGVARVNPSGHEMVSVAPFDHVVNTNAQYDRYQSAVLRHADLSVDPIILTGNDSDLPDSLLGTRAGTVFRHVGDLQQIKIADLPQSVQYMHEYFRREHEELSGALRVFEQPSGTATETERKVQEQSMLIRPDIRAIADMWRQVGLIVYWMSGQFMTKQQRFRVAGKASKMLGQYADITPDMLQEEIDLRFHGADSLQTYNQKQAGLVQWMTLAGPMLPAVPSVSLDNLLMLSFEHMVGPEYVDQIFRGRTPEWQLWSQDEENWMLLRGQEVAVNEADDHYEHMEKMAALLAKASESGAPVSMRQAVARHYMGHLQAAERKEMQRQAEMEQKQHDAKLLETSQGSQPGQGAPAAQGGMEAAPTQRTTNGPPQGRTSSRMGRDGAGVSQTQRLQNTGGG